MADTEDRLAEIRKRWPEGMEIGATEYDKKKERKNESNPDPTGGSRRLRMPGTRRSPAVRRGKQYRRGMSAAPRPMHDACGMPERRDLR